MKTSPDGIFAVAKHEGIVLSPHYDSVGVLTWGIGHTAAAGSPHPEKMDRGTPKNVDAALRRVLAVFARDLVKYEQAVNRAFKVPLKQHEFDAAVSFHYNTGAILKASWVKSFNAGNRTKAVVQIMNWKKPPEIIGRRKEEQNLFANGVYPSGAVAMYPADDNGNVQWGKAVRIPKGDFLAMMGEVSPAPVKPKGGLIALLVSIFKAIFGGRK